MVYFVRVLKAAQWILVGGMFPENFLIYSESRAATLRETKVILTFVHVNECRGFLKEISNHLKVTLI